MNVDGGIQRKVQDMELRAMGWEERHRHWREVHVPLLYDAIMSRKCPWPSACVQFGKAADQKEMYIDRTVYLSERTGEMADANTLLVATTRVPNEHVTRSADVSKKWTDSVYRDPLSSTDFKIRKRIVHPGEVNRIRELRQGIVVTHSDDPKLFIWDIERQPHRKDANSKDIEPNQPDLTLIGHQANAEYAVETAAEGSLIASGGDDKLVLIWKLEDYQTLLSSKNSQLVNRLTFKGHTKTVEGLAFRPKSQVELASCGDDRCIFMWDARQPNQAAGRIEKAHLGDVNCIDWCRSGELLASGGADHCIRIWDVRTISQSGNSKPYADLREHTGQINEVQFQPQENSKILGSCSADGQVLLWDVDKVSDGRNEPEADTGELPSILLFRHRGHRFSVAEFQWLPTPEDPWTIASISEDSEGATLQIWRVFDLIHKPANQALRMWRTQANP